MKVRIIGTSAQLKSDIKVADIELLKQYCPEALVLKDEKENAIFKIDYSHKNSSLNQYGICFNEKTKKGFAAISLSTNQDSPSDLKKNDMVAVLAPIMPNLTALTEQIAAKVKEVSKLNAELRSCIEVIDDEEDE